MSDGKSEIFSQPRPRAFSFLKEIKEIKEEKKDEKKEEPEIKIYPDDRRAWPEPPVNEVKQISDQISRYAFNTHDVLLAGEFCQDGKFQRILQELGVDLHGDHIFERFMFHPGKKRWIFEYNFLVEDVGLGRCGICSERRAHKLIIEIGRRTKEVVATCFGDLRREKKMGKLEGLWAPMDLSLSRIDQVKGDFLVEALKVGRKDKHDYKWDEYSVYDPYTLSAFIYELAAFPHASEKDVLLYAATRINRVLAIIPPETYNVKKNLESGMFHPGKGFPRMSARYTHVTEKGKKSMVTMGEKKIIEGLMAFGMVRIYQGKDVFADKNPPREFLNVWTGFQVERNILEMKDVKRVDITPLMDFLENWICSGERGLFAALMKWFVELLAHPAQKVPWAVWMYTPEKRMGKGLLCDFLFHYVFGSMTMKKFNGMAEVLHVHNAWCEGKKLVVVEEASSKAEDWKTGWDILKGWSADRTINVHRKYENQYDAKSILSFMIISNHRNSLFLEPDDRRYLCVKPTDTIGKTKRCAYFKDLQEAILTREMGREFFEFCCRTTEFDHIDPYNTDPPLNLLKEQILEENLLPELLFASEVCTMRWRVRLQACLEDVRQVEKHIEKKKKSMGFEVAEEKEPDETQEYKAMLDEFDPLDLLPDDFEISPVDQKTDGKSDAKKEKEKKEKTGSEMIAEWLPKLKTCSKEQLKLYDDEIRTLEDKMVDLIKRIGKPCNVDDEYERTLVEEMNVLCLDGPTQPTEKLYNLYCKWFSFRISDGKGKNPVSKIAFGRKMAQCMKQQRRQTHIQGRSRAWNLDSIMPMFVPFPEFETMQLWDK